MINTVCYRRASEVAREATVVRPATFLCPALAPARTSVRHQRCLPSTQASTSYLPPRSSSHQRDGRKRRQGFDTQLRYLSTYAATKVAARAGSMIHQHHEGDVPIAETYVPRHLQLKWQRVRMAQAAVIDVTEQPPELLAGGDALTLLRDAEETYFEESKGEIHILEPVVPHLALAYIHIGQAHLLVALIERYRAAFAAVGRQVSLQAWKIVMADAFDRDDYELTLRIITSGSPDLDAEDDWAMYARFESTLRIIERDHNTSSDGSEDVDAYWKEYERLGRRAPVDLFTRLIKSQVRRGLPEQIKQTMIAQQTHGYAVEEPTWRFLIQIHPRARKKGIWRNFATNLNLDCAEVFDGLVRYYCDKGNVRRLALVLRCFGMDNAQEADARQSWRPHLQTMELVIDFFLSRGMAHTALRFLHIAASLKVDRDLTPLAGRMVHGLCSQGLHQDALNVILQLLGSQISLANTDSTVKLPVPEGRSVVAISRASYSFALHAASQYDDPRKVVALTRAIFCEVFRHNLLINSRLVNKLGPIFERVTEDTGWTRYAAYLDAIAALASLSETGEHGTAPLADFLRKLRQQGSIDKAIIRTKAYRDIATTASPKPEVSEDVEVERQAVSNRPIVRPEVARESLSWMTQKSIVDRDVQSVPAGMIDRGPSSFAAAVLDTNPYVHLRQRLTSAGYLVRLHVFSIVLRDHASAMTVIRHMLGTKTRPTARHISAIIEGLVLSDRLQEARQVADNARAVLKTVGSDRGIITAFARGYARRGDWYSLQSELDKMHALQLRPHPALLALLPSGYKEGERQRRDGSGLTLPRTTAASLTSVQRRRSAMIESNYRFSKQGTAEQVMGSGAERSGAKPRLVPIRQRPNLAKTTTIFKALFDERHYMEAGLFMSRMLRAGLLSDVVLRRMLKASEGYLRRLARRQGLDPDQIAQDLAPESAYESMRALSQRRKSTQRESADEDASERTASDAVRETQLSVGYPKSSKPSDRRADLATSSARRWRGLLRLYHGLVFRTKRTHPTRVAFHEQQRQARRDLAALLSDAFVTHRLREEAQQLNLTSPPLAQPLYGPHRDVLLPRRGRREDDREYRQKQTDERRNRQA